MFNNLRIGTKLTVSFILLIVLMVVIIIVGVTRLNRLKSDLDIIIDDRYQKIRVAETIVDNAVQIAVGMRNLAIKPDKQARQIDINQIQEAKQNNEESMAKLGKIILSPEGQKLLKVINEKQTIYQELQNEVISLDQANNIAALRTLVGSERANQAREEYEQAVRDLISFQEKLMDDTQSETLQNYKDSRNLMVLIGILALVFAAATAYYLIQAIAPPITNIVAIAKRVAGGDLSSELPPVKGRDEIGELNAAFAVMHKTLKDMADIAQAMSEGDLSVKVVPQSAKDVLGTALERMVSSLGIQMQEISEGVNVLSSSTSEIMATVTQLASSAAETATSVSEATSTVEEVKQTSEVVNEKAEYVSESGRKAATISGSGQESIKKTVAGMNRIQGQMELIANIIVKLSDQSQTINEITSSVNDLAEQSNLLAVNAAIEAAKAGEQGKGFAVVAQEIKSLAEQSKEATAQVRGILTEVQKSISSAVMATEQGNKAVKEGLELSGETDKTIQTLTESIREAAEASYQIAASSKQQVAGMDQVAEAMEVIKTASTQSAASTKQTEKAVTDLHDLGDNLKSLVQRYKV